MSYDLAVWVGHPARDDDTAAEVYRELLGQLEEGDAALVPELESFLDDLLSELPDDPDQAGGSSWAGPPFDDAAGDIALLSIVEHHVDTVRKSCAQLAAAHNLTCFDPQTDEIVTVGRSA